MGTPFLAEIRIFSFNFPPQGWAVCDGQLLPINQNQALFSLLGTTYGGNGQTTFALPDLRGRIPIHSDGQFTLGSSGGEDTHTLTVAEAAHSHPALGSSAAGNLPTPANNTWAPTTQKSYASSANTTMNALALTAVGSGQAHNNVPPYLTLTFCIALIGIFPSQN
jgi:microcystin-dependent protein